MTSKRTPPHLNPLPSRGEADKSVAMASGPIASPFSRERAG
jgi:hypothetical protein